MISQTVAKIIEILFERTKENKVVWMKTHAENIFQVALPDFSIKFARYEGVDEPFMTPYYYYKISFFNHEGRLIEDLTSDQLTKELPNSSAILSELYTLARRKALNSEKALDDILSQLDREK